MPVNTVSAQSMQGNRLGWVASIVAWTDFFF